MNYGPLKTNQETIGLGKILGGGNLGLIINNSYWTNEDDGVNKSWGYAFGKISEENSNLTESDNALMGLLNGWVDDKGGECLYRK